MQTLSTKLLGSTYSVELADIPPESVAFLLSYGFKQYVADGAAVSKQDPDGNDRSDAEIEELKLDGIAKRMENIRAGDFTRTASRDPFDVEVRRVAMDFLKARAKAQKIKWPVGKANTPAGDAAKAQREKWLAELKASPRWGTIEATATANIKAREALLGADVSSLVDDDAE